MNHPHKKQARRWERKKIVASERVAQIVSISGQDIGTGVSFGAETGRSRCSCYVVCGPGFAPNRNRTTSDPPEERTTYCSSMSVLPRRAEPRMRVVWYGTEATGDLPVTSKVIVFPVFYRYHQFVVLFIPSFVWTDENM